ncbi:uncharacterized protein METZ01_LOCUS95718 [marine metagenome]|uniref:DUF4386 domain-containing protein n=1 Tax=marine metagenome TaxID=408172 RepID=A0A381VRK5_9ZZZZ
MNSKVFGSFMIVGPILAMVMWAAFVPEIGDLSVSDYLDKLIENDVAVRFGSLVGNIGFLVMLLGLFFLSRTLRSGNSIGAVCAEISGLLLIAMLAVAFVADGAQVDAIEQAKTDRAVGEGILIASMATESFGGFLISATFSLLGVALAIQRKFHLAVGCLVILVGISASVSQVITEAPWYFGLVGWIGIMLMTLVMGIWSVVQKEN